MLRLFIEIIVGTIIIIGFFNEEAIASLEAKAFKTLKNLFTK